MSKTIALIAHDNCKQEMVSWCREHEGYLAQQKLVATGTTGAQIAQKTSLDIDSVASGPLGGDLQIGARIVQGEIDLLVFFWDPLTAQPHDPDVKALLRVAVLKNIAVATNRVSADLIVRALDQET